ncbi:DUF305 domain-containing protein [Streptomyces sediminimaris]|uniref:DUF305 domain-containing protein n=1 Tax=Streptomyces sediminimaris TaxID=3383721 RepID=UPI00399A2BE2
MRACIGRLAGVTAAAPVAAGAITCAVAEGGGSSPGAPAAGSADAGFARDMAVHHQQAVGMSYLVRDRTKNAEVRRVAYDIAQTQADQRGMLLGRLDPWGPPKTSAKPPMSWMGMGGGTPGRGDGSLMPGMATGAELRRLGTLDGKQAEILCLQLMTAHHQGGVHMAEGCVARCTVGVERDLARGMVSARRSELAQMADMLKERGAQARS